MINFSNKLYFILIFFVITQLGGIITIIQIIFENENNVL